MGAAKFHQSSLTIAESKERHKATRHYVCDLTNYKLFYRVSDTRIMMTVRYTVGKNRGKFECVYYNGVMRNNMFIITDPEPEDTPIWFDNQESFDEFINNEGLTEQFCTYTFRCDNVPVLTIDDTIPALWEDFKELKKGRTKTGCWETVFINVKTGERYSTEGDIHKNTSWKDYFEWLVNDIEEMDVGALEDIKLLEVCYKGIDNEEVFVS